MRLEQLEFRWYQLMRRLRAPTQYVGPMWREINKAYSAKKRTYHNLHHLADLFSQTDRYRDQLEDVDTFELSIWYHDVIYSVLRKDNEERSALFAKYRLEVMRYPREQLIRCYHQINATKLHVLNGATDPDLPYLLDFDLSILGTRYEQYQFYCRQIRQEYGIFPTFLYNRGRKKVLRHLLERDRIYHTPAYFELFEQRARSNMEKELELLEAKTE